MKNLSFSHTIRRCEVCEGVEPYIRQQFCTLHVSFGWNKKISYLFSYHIDDDCYNVKSFQLSFKQHDKICEFPSNQFYKGQLKTHDKDECVSDAISAIWPVQSSPIVFCHVGDGVEEKLTHSMEDGNELSRNNKAEVQQVVTGLNM